MTSMMKVRRILSLMDIDLDKVIVGGILIIVMTFILSVKSCLQQVNTYQHEVNMKELECNPA